MNNATIGKIRSRLGIITSRLSSVRSNLWYYENYLRIIPTDRTRVIAKIQRYDREEKRLLIRFRRLNLFNQHLYRETER